MQCRLTDVSYGAALEPSGRQKGWTACNRQTRKEADMRQSCKADAAVIHAPSLQAQPGGCQNTLRP